MKKRYYFLSFVFFLCITDAFSQTKTISITENPPISEKANYQAAARFSPAKLKNSIFIKN